MRSSSGSRCRISSGKRSCTRRAPCLAASSTVTGAGVATATPSQISADSAKPASAAISSQKACRGPSARSRQRPAEKRGRNRGQRNQPNIDDAMNLLAAAAAFTGREVVFVVAAHLRRQAGYIIPPARQNLTHDRINALLTHWGYEANHILRNSHERQTTKGLGPVTAGSAAAPRSAAPEARGYETIHPA